MQTLPTSSTLNKSFYSIPLTWLWPRGIVFTCWIEEWMNVFFFSVCEQAAEFSKSCNLIGFVILYELLCRSCSFPPLLILGFTSESRPVLKWYCLLYLEFSLHNNWPFFFFLSSGVRSNNAGMKKKKTKQKK